jgi:hypothetical protein
MQAVWEWLAECHGADKRPYRTVPYSAGMASSGGLAEQRRDMIPRHVRGVARIRL